VAAPLFMDAHPTPVPSLRSYLPQRYHALMFVSIFRNAGEKVAQPPSATHGMACGFTLTLLTRSQRLKAKLPPPVFQLDTFLKTVLY